MNNTKCLLIDDEPPAIELLKNHIGHFNNLEVTATGNNAIQASELLKQHSIDLLFLDIEMPSVTGFELLDALTNPPQVIITTAYRKYATQSYEFDVTDYLLKPISLERFIKALNRYHERTQCLKPEHQIDDASFYVLSNKKNIRINYSDLLYVQGLKDYTRFHLIDKELLVKGNIGKFEKLLPEPWFMRTHRSYIVSMQKVTAFTHQDVEIGNREIPIGVSYKKSLHDFLKSS